MGPNSGLRTFAGGYHLRHKHCLCRITVLLIQKNEQRGQVKGLSERLLSKYSDRVLLDSLPHPALLPPKLAPGASCV